MTSFVTPKFRVFAAERFIESVVNPQTRHYMFVANPLPFPNENQPPNPIQSVETVDFQIFDQIMFAKYIRPQDISLMIKKTLWESGVVYSEYDDKNPNLSESNYIVVSPESGSYHVFICLSNGGGAASRAAPLFSETFVGDESYIKVLDGYQWKYVTTIPGEVYAKFVTADKVPFVDNQLVVNAAVNGAIEVIKVEYGGANYNSYFEGYFVDFAVGGNPQIFAIDNTASADSGFYTDSTLYITSGTGAGQYRNILSYTVAGTQKRVVLQSAFSTFPDSTSQFVIAPKVNIQGDGTGAAAIARINPLTGNSISEVTVLNQGQNYSFANVVVTGNTGINGQSTNSAITRAIISPIGGHGANLDTQLIAKGVGISIQFANSEGNTIPTNNEYRTVGLLASPLLANVELSVSSNIVFLNGDVIRQQTSGATGKISFANTSLIKVTNVAGTFAANLTIEKVSNTSVNTLVSAVTGYSSIINCSTRLGITTTFAGLAGSGFSQDELVTSTNGVGNVLVANTTHLAVINVKGVFAPADIIVGTTSGATATINNLTPSDIVPYSGEILYIENMRPVTRTPTQSETIQLVFSF